MRSKPANAPELETAMRLKSAVFMKRISTSVFLWFALTVSCALSQKLEPPFELPPRDELRRIRSAVIGTSKGNLFLELYPEQAPWHVTNFKYLADKGFYKGLLFHRHIPGYALEGGDPQGTGLGGTGYTLPAEFSALKHQFGTVGMLRKPDIFGSDGRPINPRRQSSGSQFYISLSEAPNMDGSYTIFGRVVSGLEALRDLKAGDRIEFIDVFVR
jgi:cyclophilin family peptidyl-prolyl cis-trans isomerase